MEYKIKDLLLVFIVHVQFIQIVKVNLIIQHIDWNIPRDLSILPPQIVKDILKINLPFDNTIVDKLIWKLFTNCDLYFKDIYNCMRRGHVEPFWTKFIWHPYIPHVKSFVT